jgi:hypothetical protein
MGRLSIAIAAAAWLALGLPARGDPSPASTPSVKLTPAQQREICFPASRFASVRQTQGPGLILWTDSTIDEKMVLTDLIAARNFLEAMLWPPKSASPAPPKEPSPGNATAPANAPSPAVAPGASASGPPAASPVLPPAGEVRPLALAVYARKQDYQELWQRVGRLYNGEFGQIRTAGYSYGLFCATSYAGGDPADARAVLAHEMAHLYLHQNLGLPNDGNWLTEGIAAAVQLRLFPQAGDRAQFARMAQEGRMLPLKRLMDLPNIQSENYWQAATLVETICRHYPGRLPAVISAWNDKLPPLRMVQEVLGGDMEGLTRQWQQDLQPTGLPVSSPPRR